MRNLAIPAITALMVGQSVELKGGEVFDVKPRKSTLTRKNQAKRKTKNKMAKRSRRKLK